MCIPESLSRFYRLLSVFSFMSSILFCFRSLKAAGNNNTDGNCNISDMYFRVNLIPLHASKMNCKCTFCIILHYTITWIENKISLIALLVLVVFTKQGIIIFIYLFFLVRFLPLPRQILTHNKCHRFSLSLTLCCICVSACLRARELPASSKEISCA